ncbi:GyrI-like domain-containing protein [Xanthomarina gelatinilytica]|uniref:GyrI-like domain-containing protein n=1 Tax=Xanthomarina gelatinilytica TaxID=1137281 RepID=UPI00351538C4
MKYAKPMMPDSIKTVNDRLVVGMKANMSFKTMQEETGNLAKQFMPRRNEISSRIGTHVFSIQDFGDFLLKNITALTEFEKWVGVEVSNFDHVPEGMETFVLKAGTYAVFTYKGAMQDVPKFKQSIFKDWLPNSNYQLDTRAHFEILPENYSKDLHATEEDFWIPIK